MRINMRKQTTQEYLDKARDIVIVVLVMLWIPLCAWGIILIAGML
jgi:hypothetical protein